MGLWQSGQALQSAQVRTRCSDIDEIGPVKSEGTRLHGVGVHPQYIRKDRMQNIALIGVIGVHLNLIRTEIGVRIGLCKGFYQEFVGDFPGFGGLEPAGLWLAREWVGGNGQGRILRNHQAEMAAFVVHPIACWRVAPWVGFLGWIGWIVANVPGFYQCPGADDGGFVGYHDEICFG